jgi:hypothetical protein
MGFGKKGLQVRDLKAHDLYKKYLSIEKASIARAFGSKSVLMVPIVSFL